VIYHAFNGLRIILFDFWPNLALKQKAFAYVEFALVAAAFLPVAFFMLRSAFETSPFA
jgi:succinate dehydrogenase / fumarate reductase cytochrome b subunit